MRSLLISRKLEVLIPKREKATHSRALHDEEIEVISISYTLGSSRPNLVFLLASIQDTQ